MGKAFKITLIGAIIFSLMTFAIAGFYVNENINYKIKSVENQLLIMDKRREYYSEQVISLQSVKDNLETRIAMEVDKNAQQALQDQMISLNEQQKLEAQQRLAAEQARLDALRQQQLQAQQLQQQQAQQAAKQTTTVKTVKTTTTTTRTRAS